MDKIAVAINVLDKNSIQRLKTFLNLKVLNIYFTKL